MGPERLDDSPEFKKPCECAGLGATTAVSNSLLSSGAKALGDGYPSNVSKPGFMAPSMFYLRIRNEC